MDEEKQSFITNGNFPLLFSTGVWLAWKGRVELKLRRTGGRRNEKGVGKKFLTSTKLSRASGRVSHSIRPERFFSQIGCW